MCLGGSPVMCTSSASESTVGSALSPSFCWARLITPAGWDVAKPLAGTPFDSAPPKRYVESAPFAHGPNLTHTPHSGGSQSTGGPVGAPTDARDFAGAGASRSYCVYVTASLMSCTTSTCVTWFGRKPWAFPPSHLIMAVDLVVLVATTTQKHQNETPSSIAYR